MQAVPSPQLSFNLKPYNTFGLSCVARALVRVSDQAQVRRLMNDPAWINQERFILGGGSNVLLTRDLDALVLKVEIMGKRLLSLEDDAWIVEAGAGESWHGLVSWCQDQGLPGLENLAMIPGTVGAAPVQNIGAYGLELRDRFHSLDALDLVTGRAVTLGPQACRFDYRDSVFKRELAGKSLITRVRLRLPRPWRPVLGYIELDRKMSETGRTAPTARDIFDWVCEIRSAKLPDPAVLGNAGSFFKNPVVTPEQCRDIIQRDPEIVHYPMADGSYKLAAGWLIDACGWKGKSIGQAGVYEKQALVLVNRGGASGSEIVTLARAIQESVYGRFGIRLEPEPVVR